VVFFGAKVLFLFRLEEGRIYEASPLKKGLPVHLIDRINEVPDYLKKLKYSSFFSIFTKKLV
jgi:hypothetical protein